MDVKGSKDGSSSVYTLGLFRSLNSSDYGPQLYRYVYLYYWHFFLPSSITFFPRWNFNNHLCDQASMLSISFWSVSWSWSHVISLHPMMCRQLLLGRVYQLQTILVQEHSLEGCHYFLVLYETYDHLLHLPAFCFVGNFTRFKTFIYEFP